jgi:hypothetical protein
VGNNGCPSRAPVVKAWFPAEGAVGSWWGLVEEIGHGESTLEGVVEILAPPLSLLLPGHHEVSNFALPHIPGMTFCLSSDKRQLGQRAME